MKAATTQQTTRDLIIKNLRAAIVAQRYNDLIESARREESGELLALTGYALCEMSLSGDLFEAGQMCLGWALNASGATGRARVVFKHVSESGVLLRQAQAKLALGNIALWQRDYDGAWQYLHAAIKDANQDTQIIHNSIHNLALIEAMKGNYSGALDTLTVALCVSKHVPLIDRLDSLNSAAWNLGVIGRTDEGRKLIEQVLSFGCRSKRSRAWIDTKYEIEACDVARQRMQSRCFIQTRNLVQFPIKSIEGNARGRIMEVTFAPERTEGELLEMAESVERIAGGRR